MGIEQNMEKLNRYQSEYDAIQSQSNMLSQTVESLQVQLEQGKSYLQSNPGDKNAKNKYNELLKNYNAYQAQLSRNARRLADLDRKITLEQQKVGLAQQRFAAQMQKREARQMQKMANQQQRMIVRQNQAMMRQNQRMANQQQRMMMKGLG